MTAAARLSSTQRLRLIACVALCLASALLVGAPSAGAVEAPPAPYWKLDARSAPTNLPLEGERLKGAGDEKVSGEGMIVITATNLGGAEVLGEAKPVTITDKLPAGLEIVRAKSNGLNKGEGVEGRSGKGIEPGFDREVSMSCEVPHKGSASEAALVECKFAHNIPPHEQLEVLIPITVKISKPTDLTNEVTATGGETKPRSFTQTLKVHGGATSFGVERFSFTPEDENGEPDTQAGSQPYQLTTTFDLNQNFGDNPELPSPGDKIPLPEAPALQKDIEVKLPPGLIGDPQAVPKCSGVNFGALDEKDINNCTDNTAIGVAQVTFMDPILLNYQTETVPVFNLEPAPGEPARFGFEVVHVPVVFDTSVRSGQDYGVNVTVKNASEAVQVLGAQVTLWGVPGDPRHDESRGWNCLGHHHWVLGFEPPLECKKGEFAQPATPFLLLPTSCSSSRQVVVTGDSWSGDPLSAENELPEFTGCGELPFSPSIKVSAAQSSGSTPTGMTVDVNVPQKETTLVAGKLAEGTIRATTLALPPEVQASAGAANGLETCTVGQAGFSGIPTTGPVSEGELETQRFTPAAAMCPNGSKIGTVNIATPLLEKELVGGVYLASQDTNPFASPLVLYIIAEEEHSKTIVKLAGEVRVDQGTGQLISVFKNTPPVPFETLKIELFDGGRASQATPAHCGPKNATATFIPWTASVTSKTAGGEAAEGFQIPCVPGGAPPVGTALPLAPKFQAGANNTQAGAFAPFNVELERPDGQQQLTGLSMRLPQGAAAMLSSVTPCPIAKADAAACGPESLIGHAQVSSGLGGTPYTLGGQVFLTEGFAGAPFGVSVMTPAEHVGPFTIGKIIANSTIRVDENTAQAIITAADAKLIEPNGNTKALNAALPTRVKGVPVELKKLKVAVDRPNFEFNPTNCNSKSVTGAAMAVTDTLTGDEGASFTSSYAFGVTGCGSLPFSPKFTAEVSGQGSKAGGTSFTVKVESSRGQANIAKTFLQLPIALPSRLSTLQQACLAATFAKNVASCPEGSNIGFAVAHTPVLRKPLTGPAYLVSYGAEKFPDVEFVLQGEGITLLLDGKTDIKGGITYSRFETVPDAPVEKFETVLPAGPHSALTANVPESEHFSLCKQTLLMPTEIVGQNGAVLKQTTKIALGGCALNFKVKKTALQIALEKCRKTYKGHSKKARKKRAACEARARKKHHGKKASHTKHSSH